MKRQDAETEGLPKKLPVSEGTTNRYGERKNWKTSDINTGGFFSHYMAEFRQC